MCIVLTIVLEVGALFWSSKQYGVLYFRGGLNIFVSFLPVTMGSVPTVLSPWGVIIPHALNLTFANFLCNARISHDCKLAVIAGQGVRPGHSPIPLILWLNCTRLTSILSANYPQRDVVHSERDSASLQVSS